MQTGIFVSEAWGQGSTVDEVRERARQAEALGYPSAWVPYLPWAIDSMAAMQAAGEATQHIEIGSAVIPTYFFHPLAMARQAITAQAAIGRPIHLGIGCSNPAVIEMHGMAFERPARHVREYLQILEKAFEAGSQPSGSVETVGFVEYQGEMFNLASIYGSPLAQPIGSTLVGALGPHMLRATGACSDGVIATWSDERVIEHMIAPPVISAAADVGRSSPRIAAVVATAIVSGKQVDKVREAAQAMFGIYEQTMPYQRMIDASASGKVSGICVIGDEEEVARRLRGYREAGLTEFIAAPLSVEGATWQATAERLAAIDVA